MNTQSIGTFVRALVFALLATTLFTTPAAAWQCTEITEYAEQWYEEGDTVLTLYGKAIADAGGEPCGVTIRAYMIGPNGTEVASGYGYGNGYAERTVYVYFDENAPEQDEIEYYTASEAWSQGVHYGCAWSGKFWLGAQITNYQWVSSTPRTGWSAYYRCTTGGCLSMVFNSTASYVRALVITIRTMPNMIATCWGFSKESIGSCAG